MNRVSHRVRAEGIAILSDRSGFVVLTLEFDCNAFERPITQVLGAMFPSIHVSHVSGFSPHLFSRSV
jgi:hypothetical protein